MGEYGKKYGEYWECGGLGIPIILIEGSVWAEESLPGPFLQTFGYLARLPHRPAGKGSLARKYWMFLP